MVEEQLICTLPNYKKPVQTLTIWPSRAPLRDQPHSQPEPASLAPWPPDLGLQPPNPGRPVTHTPPTSVSRR
ncbi:hypothetical protein LZ31DRAFT_552026 [Colletotrichum somersetense]|nr:hypothetical protein LZ31DRAFT_552026 [Colletotrichum somersetense]